VRPSKVYDDTPSIMARSGKARWGGGVGSEKGDSDLVLDLVRDENVANQYTDATAITCDTAVG